MATVPYTTPYYSAVQRRRASDDLMRATKPMWGTEDEFLSDFDPSAAISGGLGLAGNYLGMVNQGLGLGPAPGLQRSATGEPVYNLGSSFNQAFLADPQGASSGEVLSGVGQGALAGSAFGPIGTGVGAIVGGAVSIFGGNRRRKKQQEERRRALNSVSAKQRSFNTASLNYDRSQTAMNDYRNRINIDDQLYNLYR